jgi:hypothetical protein
VFSLVLDLVVSLVDDGPSLVHTSSLSTNQNFNVVLILGILDVENIFSFWNGEVVAVVFELLPPITFDMKVVVPKGWIFTTVLLFNNVFIVRGRSDHFQFTVENEFLSNTAIEMSDDIMPVVWTSASVSVKISLVSHF